MKTFTLRVFVQNPDSGEMQPVGDQTQFRANDADDARSIARAKLIAMQHPPVRSISIGPDRTILAYCAPIQNRAEPIEGMTEYKRPPGPVRL